MKIFYTASYYGKAEYQKNYDQVLAAIKSHQVELISPEIGNYKQILTTTDLENLKTEREIHYLAIKKGILWADAVIIEISQEDFQLGHEATLAIQSKKPVLCLSIHQDFSLKIKNRYFHATKYNQYTIDEIVESFLIKAKKESLKERFNLFLSPSQLVHLKSFAKKNQMNSSEYLRSLLDQN